MQVNYKAICVSKAQEWLVCEFVKNGMMPWKLVKDLGVFFCFWSHIETKQVFCRSIVSFEIF